MKKLGLIGLLFLTTGCNKLMPMPLIGSTAITQSSIYVISGQSNSYYMGQRETATFMKELHATAVINCGWPRTEMKRWTLGGDQYLGCIDEIKTALATYPGSTLKGIIFWQGESDCNAQDVSLWVGRFRAMVAGFQSLFSNIPVVFAQITDIHTDYRDEMRSYQTGVVIAGVTMVRTEGIVYDGDHTDNAGYHIMAERFIQALRQTEVK